MAAIAETALRESIDHITGLIEGFTPLGGRRVLASPGETQRIIADFFQTVISESETDLSNPLRPLFDDLPKAFVSAYCGDNEAFVEKRLNILRWAQDANIRLFELPGRPGLRPCATLSGAARPWTSRESRSNWGLTPENTSMKRASLRTAIPTACACRT